MQKGKIKFKAIGHDQNIKVCIGEETLGFLQS